MHQPSVEIYSALAYELLSGKTINTSLFGQLELPDVPENIAMIVMAGPVFKSDICGAAGTRNISFQIEKAAADSSIQAIILYQEDVPGGQATGMQELSRAITTAKAKKPVIGIVSGMSASAGYHAIASTTEAYALNESDLIGCIGVMAKMRNPKTVDASKESFIEVYSDLSPDKNQEFSSPENLKQSLLNPLAELFHRNVMGGRGSKLKLKKENVLSGKTYLAESAVEHGLIDGIMPMNKIIGRANFLSKKRNTK